MGTWRRGNGDGTQSLYDHTGHGIFWSLSPIAIISWPSYSTAFMSFAYVPEDRNSEAEKQEPVDWWYNLDNQGRVFLEENTE